MSSDTHRQETGWCGKCFYKFGVRSLFYVWKFIVNYEISERNFVRRSKHAQKQRCDAHEDFHEILRTKGETRPKTWRKIKMILKYMKSADWFIKWQIDRFKIKSFSKSKQYFDKFLSYGKWKKHLKKLRKISPYLDRFK